MEFTDYYDTLEVKRDATPDEIKRACRKLARKYHPDVNKEANAETRFKQVGEAYEVLRNPEKRAAQDQLGRTGRQARILNRRRTGTGDSSTPGPISNSRNTAISAKTCSDAAAIAAAGNPASKNFMRAVKIPMPGCKSTWKTLTRVAAEP